MRPVAAALLVWTLVACGSGGPASGPADGELLTCVGPPFSAAVFERAADAEEAGTPEAEVLGGAVGGPELPAAERGWRELGRTDDEVAFATGEPPLLTGYVVLRRDGGRWAVRGFGSGCVVRPYRPSREVARWGLDPGAPR